MQLNLKFLSLLLWIISFSTLVVKAQGIQGKVTDPNGKAVPFATIYTQSAEYSTTSNAQGDFQLKLPQGTHEVFFHSMGLKTVSRTVEVKEAFVKVEVQMDEQVIMLREVKVEAGKEDPAYNIMRKAIAMRSYYEHQVQAYKAKAYVKGTALVQDIPSVYKMMMSKEDRKEMESFVGKTQVVESIAEVSFEQPNKYDHKIVATRSSLPDEAMDGVPMIIPSLYHERFLNKILSPLAASAFRHYHFTYEGFFEDEGRFINKIKVTPRHKGEGLFEGHIYIAEDYWNLHSADLKFEVEFVDNHLKLTYAPVQENVWLPVTHEAKAKASFMGVDADIQYIVSVKEYEVTLNPKLNHQLLAQNESEPKEEEVKEESEKLQAEQQITALLQKDQLNNRQARKLRRKISRESRKAERKKSLEITKEEGFNLQVDSMAHKKSNEYWEEVRSVPLTREEKISYLERDTLLLSDAQKIEVDTMVQKPKNPGWQKTKKGIGNFLFGTRFGKSFKYSGLVNELSYNTVDGWKPSVSLSYSKEYSRKNDFKITTRLGYAVSRNAWLPVVKFERSYAPMKRAGFAISGGRNSVDFNEEDGVSPTLNTFSTLFLKWNLMKLYQKDFIRIDHRIDIANGMVLENTLEFANRSWLDNTDSLDIFNWTRSFSPNSPENVESELTSFGQHQAFVVGTNITYTPWNRYRIREGAKYMARPTYPTFNLAYRKALQGVNSSDVSYDYLAFSMKQRKDLTFQHDIEYQLKAGAFFNKKNMSFADYHHFRNIQLPFYFGRAFGNFRLFDYYEQSTQEWFLQGNVAFYSNRLILKRLPLLNETFMNETLFANYLYTPEMGHYTEVGYALTEIFFLASAEVATGFINGKFEGITFKVGFLFD
jgi:hypothetical protein